MTSKSLAIVSATLLLAACEGALFVRGVAYSVSSGNGCIAIDEKMATGDLKTLDGVKITLYHSRKYIDKTDSTSVLCRNHATSDAAGKFETGSTAAPGWYDVAIRAEKPGCVTVTRTFSMTASNMKSRWS